MVFRIPASLATFLRLRVEPTWAGRYCPPYSMHREQQLLTFSQPAALGSQPANDQQIAITSPEPVLLPFRSHNNPSHSEIIRMEEGRQAGTSGQHGFNEGPSACSEREKMWNAMLILGILFLVIIPGLVIGIITKEIPVGIALSGAIATVTSLFAGIYYYYNK